MILVPLPDFRDVADFGMFFDLCPSHGPVHIPRAHEYAFAIDALGIGHVQVRRMRQQQRQRLLEIQAEVKTGHGQVRQVQAQAQLVRFGLRRQFIRHHENVLMPLPAEVPREGRHVLRRSVPYWRN